MGAKMYKGFDKDMKCRGFQYAIGETYHEKKADLCNAGFHACENPLDVFNYYHPREGAHICEVELDDVCAKTDVNDTKRCGKTIKIGAELNIAGLCKAHFEYVTARCEPAKSNAAGDKESASAGESGSASTGSCGSASAGSRGSASAGKNGIACALFGKVKGELGCAICTTEQDDDGNNIAVKAAIVDGVTIKANTWYKVENGEWLEVNENA